MFNENLKIIRKAKGYTQEALAIKIHVVRQTISKWEKGLSVPDADTLSKLADVLEIKAEDYIQHYATMGGSFGFVLKDKIDNNSDDFLKVF